MTGQLTSILPSIAFLGALALIALGLTLRRRPVEPGRAQAAGLPAVAAVAIAAQGVHFLEELATGFAERFPALFGLDPMPLGFFVGFNAAWLAIWASCVWLLTRQSRAAAQPAVPSRAVLFPLWFLALGCLANCVAHPVMALVAGGYFPGLVTSPVGGLVGVALLRRLGAATQTF